MQENLTTFAGKLMISTGKFYNFCRKSCLFFQENLMIFGKKSDLFLELMIIAGKIDNFYFCIAGKFNLLSFAGKLDDLHRKILQFL